MSKYKSIEDVPFNATADTKYFWNTFIKQTLAGNANAALNAYHEYSMSKEMVFEGYDTGEEIIF